MTATATTAPATTRRAWNGVAGYKLLVTGMNNGTTTATATAEDRLGDILAGNTDLFTTVDVGYGTLVDGVCNRLLDVLAIAAQETLAVDGTLILAVQATINNVGHTH